MNRENSDCKPELGIALILAMLMILVLTVLAASIIFVTQSQIWTSINYRLTTQCRYAAEAGVQRTMNWLNNTYQPPAGPIPPAAYVTTTYPVTCTAAPCTGGSVVLSAVANSVMPPNYPDTAQQTAFASALSSSNPAGVKIPGLDNTYYSSYATLLAMGNPGGPPWLGPPAPQTWQITSFGNITGVRQAQVQVKAVYQRQVSPIFGDAIYGTSHNCASATPPSVAFQGVIDSYDSGTGPYPAGVATGAAANADLGSNGNLTINGAASQIDTFSVPDPTVDTCPQTLTFTGGASAASVTGPPPQPIVVTQAPTFPNPVAPSPAPPTTVQPIGPGCAGLAGCANVPPNPPNHVSLAPGPNGIVAVGSGLYGNVIISANTQVDLSAGTYNINALYLTGSSTLNITSGPVILNIAGSGITGTIPVFDITNGLLTTGSPTLPPSQLQIVYGGTQPIKLTGGAGAAGVVYAPNATIQFTGGAQWTGAVVGSTVAAPGVNIHYDRALLNSQYLVGNFYLQLIGKFYPLSMSWSKY